MIHKRARRILTLLEKNQPQALVELNHTTPFELMVATILSAQCTDERVNQVTPALFHTYPTAKALALAKPSELEAIIRPTGFFRSKANNLIRCSRSLVDTFHGEVPQTLESLTSLPGIGRKTANVILGTCFQVPAIVVDTHVKRLANRLALTTSTDPTQIEYDLQTILPRKQWISGAQRLLLHGRYVCVARTPKCKQCVIYSECEWEGKQPVPC